METHYYDYDFLDKVFSSWLYVGVYYALWMLVFLIKYFGDRRFGWGKAVMIFLMFVPIGLILYNAWFWHYGFLDKIVSVGHYNGKMYLMDEQINAGSRGALSYTHRLTQIDLEDGKTLFKKKIKGLPSIYANEHSLLMPSKPYFNHFNLSDGTFESYNLEKKLTKNFPEFASGIYSYDLLSIKDAILLAQNKNAEVHYLDLNEMKLTEYIPQIDKSFFENPFTCIYDVNHPENHRPVLPPSLELRGDLKKKVYANGKLVEGITNNIALRLLYRSDRLHLAFFIGFSTTDREDFSLYAVYFPQGNMLWEMTSPELLGGEYPMPGGQLHHVFEAEEKLIFMLSGRWFALQLNNGHIRWEKKF